MRVLFLTKYSAMGASSRYRTLQYLPYLESMGISCEHSPLFGNDYLTLLYQKKRRGITIILRSVFHRMFFLLFHASNFNLIVIEKELFPYFPAIFARYLLLIKVPFILDYDDAVFHNYDKNRRLFIRNFLGGKIPFIIRRSHGVLAGNEYILNYAAHYRLNRIYYLPTVINLQKYTQKDNADEAKFIIGWIGSASTSQNIIMLNKPLNKFCDKYNATVRLVGFDKDLAPELDFPHEIIDWVQDEEPNEINKFSVGIMPLMDTPFNRGKCGFKLIQYYGCGLPVIASPVGVNNKIITHGKNGLLAKTENDWYRSFEVLHNDRELGHRMGARGRELVSEEYSLEKTKIKYHQIIRSFLDR